jgi:hypothetical protein
VHDRNGSDRPDWLSSLRETESAAKYLWTSGAIAYQQVEGPGEATLTDFVSRLSDGDDGRSQIALAYFLLRPSLRHFCEIELPKLLRALGHSTQQAPRRKESTIRGKIHWPETILGRYSGTVPRGTYVTAPVEKIADIPENRLLKYLLQRIVHFCDTLFSVTSAESAPEQVIAVRSAAFEALKNPYLSSVSNVRSVTSHMVQRALRSRHPVYGAVARHWSSMRNAVELGRWAAVVELLQEGWVAPVAPEDLFELYTLVIVLESLEYDMNLGAPKIYGLIRAGRGAVAKFNHVDGTVLVYFNQRPSSFVEIRSKYTALIKAHSGVSGSERRPDITIRTTGVCVKTVIIEAKHTSDPRYISDSVYKVYGYLHDFSELWEPNQSPKAVLFFSSPVRILAPSEHFGEHELIACSDREGISSAVAYALGLARASEAPA